jgi:hypothetical protein
MGAVLVGLQAQRNGTHSAKPLATTRWCNHLAAAPAAAAARSRAMASVSDCPSHGNVMFPTVVTPPAMAARDPLEKSSTQAGVPGVFFHLGNMARLRQPAWAGPGSLATSRT